MRYATKGGGLKNKAFTLIELLAVIIILAVIALIVYPIIMGTIERSEKASFARSIDGLIESVRIDLSEDDFVSPREYFYDVRKLTLLTVNDKTRDEDVKIEGRIDGNGFIYIDEDGNIIIEGICNKKYCASGSDKEITITDNEEGELPKLEKTDPMISLIGDAIIYCNLGEEYKELGAKARTKVGEKLEYITEIKKNNEVVGSIDTTREGTYEVVYSASNNEKTVSVTRTVVVLDMTPVITMTEPKESYVRNQDVLINVTATKPNKVTEFTYQVKKDGTIIKTENISGLTKTLSFSETGIYEVTVSVTDNNGHSNQVSKTYKVDHTGPVITFDPEIIRLESEEVNGYDLLTGVTVNDNIEGSIPSSNVSTLGEVKKQAGSYEITYKVSDSLGNETTSTRTFVVTDLTKPEITISPNEQSTFVKTKTITITATDNIGVKSISYVLIKDNARGTATSINNGGIVTVNSTGNYQIEVTAIDSSDNTTVKTSGVYKIDTTVPSISFTDNVIVKITEVNGYDLMTGVTTDDNSKVIDRVEKSGLLSASLETQKITYTVYDQAGNSASKTRTFTIVEADGPILGLSNEGSASWTKAQTIKATASDNSNLSTFTYEVFKNNVSQGVKNVTVSGKSGSVDIPLNADGTYTIKLTAKDQYGNSSTKTSTSTYKIDVTAPTAPTTMNFVYGNWSAYSNNTWTNQTVYVARTQASPGPTGSTDVTSGVAKYQMSVDNKNWVDYSYTASGNYLLSTDGTHTRYFRAVDNAGNASTSISRVAKIDKTAPTAGTATFTGTTGSNDWYTSNVTVNVTNGSDATSGHKSTVSSVSKITSNTTGTKVTITTTDNAGNTATRDYTIKVDKTAPTLAKKIGVPDSFTTVKIAKNSGYSDKHLCSSLFEVSYGPSGGNWVNDPSFSVISFGSSLQECAIRNNAGVTTSIQLNVKRYGFVLIDADPAPKENTVFSGSVSTGVTGNGTVNLYSLNRQTTLNCYGKTGYCSVLFKNVECNEMTSIAGSFGSVTSSTNGRLYVWAKETTDTSFAPPSNAFSWNLSGQSSLLTDYNKYSCPSSGKMNVLVSVYDANVTVSSLVGVRKWTPASDVSDWIQFE